MRVLDTIMKHVPRRRVREEVTLERVDFSKNGYTAVITYSNGNTWRVRTEKALREAGVFD